MTTLGGTPASAHESLWPLTDLAASRVQIADKVAAAKFGTAQLIADPVREQQILDTLAAKSLTLGLDPRATRRFFLAQIEANKVVQRGLFARWTVHPEDQPTTRPDLATEVRPVLDQIDAGLLAQLAATPSARAGRGCDVLLAVAVHVIGWQRQLDVLHEQALAESVRPACTSPR
jgi:chorismate mutase